MGDNTIMHLLFVATGSDKEASIEGMRKKLSFPYVIMLITVVHFVGWANHFLVSVAKITNMDQNDVDYLKHIFTLLQLAQAPPNRIGGLQCVIGCGKCLFSMGLSSDLILI